MIEIARSMDKAEVEKLDRHIPPSRLEECIRSGQVYVLKEASEKSGDFSRCLAAGVLRYSLFWQTIPFLDLLYIEEEYRRRGFGTEMMRRWEADMKRIGYTSVMTSTQADEDAWRFYEKLGYRRIGGFFPAGQEAEEWIYEKRLEEEICI